MLTISTVVFTQLIYLIIWGAFCLVCMKQSPIKSTTGYEHRKIDSHAIMHVKELLQVTDW